MAVGTRYGRSVERLLRELEDLLQDRDSRVWMVPIEEEYSAMVAGNANRAEYRRYVTDRVVKTAVEARLLVKDRSVSYTPPIIVPDRMTKGVPYRDTALMSYKGYQVRWPSQAGLGYTLDLEKLNHDLKKFRSMNKDKFIKTAHRMGLDHKAIYRVESGFAPSADNLLRLMAMMGVRDYLKYMKEKEEE